MHGPLNVKIRKVNEMWSERLNCIVLMIYKILFIYIYIYIYMYMYIYCAFVGLDNRPTNTFVRVIRRALTIARTWVTIIKYDHALCLMMAWTEAENTRSNHCQSKMVLLHDSVFNKYIGITMYMIRQEIYFLKYSTEAKLCNSLCVFITSKISRLNSTERHQISYFTKLYNRDLSLNIRLGLKDFQSAAHK